MNCKMRMLQKLTDDPMLRWIGGLMDRLCAAAGAVLVAQAPLFMQQYTQQLVARQAELQLQINILRRNAALSGKTLEQLAQKFMANPDLDIARQGEMMLSTFDRWHHLSKASIAMHDASIWSKPFVFLYYLNGDVCASTWQRYTIGLPLTVEGGVYALFGVACGYALFALLRTFARKVQHYAWKV